MSTALSYLDEYNKLLDNETRAKKEQIENQRKKLGYIAFEDYSMNVLKTKLFEILKEGLKEEFCLENKNEIELSFIDRNKFQGDLCIKIDSLLKKYKAGEYIKNIVPRIITILSESGLYKNETITQISQKAIYVNLCLGDKYLFESLNCVFEHKEKYGENNQGKDQSIVVEYSSPNTAKHLHAGHIRSTIIGQVLANIYDANGFYTHRINHINDWGGFGFIIEGYQRWSNILTSFEKENDLLFAIYTLYRKGEKAASSGENFSELSKKESEELEKYYGDFSSYQDFQILYQNFDKAAKETFQKLENGEKSCVDIWKKMVTWSMQEFNEFYDLLGIHQDYIIGESFYGKMGKKLILDFYKEKKVLLYTKEMADEDIALLKESGNDSEEFKKFFAIVQKEILHDVGSYLVRLPNFERFVVLKKDESTIYATRDIATLHYRIKTFQPQKIIYEAGQEQGEHFTKLFASADILGINKNTTCSHVYHGFYVNPETNKKLSSRDGASNVQNLIQESIQYFKNKYNTDEKSLTPEAVDDIAYKLAIGSIIINDIKKDKKNNVAISADIGEACRSFEESGGAYIAYSICRANSILRKADSLPKIGDFATVKLENIEKILINDINNYPLIVAKACKYDNPSLLCDFLLSLSRNYNSYYNAFRVLGDEGQYRLVITKAVSMVLTNGMKLCNISVPERI